MSKEDIWRIIRRNEKQLDELLKKRAINRRSKTLKVQIKQTKKLLKQYYNMLEEKQ